MAPCSSSRTPVWRQQKSGRSAERLDVAWASACQLKLWPDIFLHPINDVTFVVQTYQLLNVDDHASFLRRHGKDPSQYRPDICHQVPESGYVVFDEHCSNRLRA